MAEKLKIISLGGLNEIGKNMTVYEYGEDIIVVDVGMGFPDDDMYGIDVVIPDITYLIKNKDRIRGIFLTHGHEDHIGAMPYVMRDIHAPVYATRMTAGLVELKLDEHKLLDKTTIRTCEAGDVIRAGKFTVEFIHMNHSIADAVAFAITCPVGTVVHTGDFKIDPTPISGGMIDLARLGALGNKGVLALLCDSTNVERPGYTKSERAVGDSFDALFKGCDERIIVTTFASNVDRIQQVINVAARYSRKVAVSGRSMENALKVSTQLGYMNVPEGTVVPLEQIKSLPKKQVCIITTGSQGESMSALTRIAFSTHRQIDIQPGDRVILSASAIPGNENSIGAVVNELYRKGGRSGQRAGGRSPRLRPRLPGGTEDHPRTGEAEVLHPRPRRAAPPAGTRQAGSGDGHEPQKRPHQRHRQGHRTDPQLLPHQRHRALRQCAGGRLRRGRRGQRRPPRPQASGRGRHDRGGGHHVRRGRKRRLRPDIITRGFVYVKESEQLMDELRGIACQTLYSCEQRHLTDWATIKSEVKGDLSSFLYKKTKRNPMILPVIMEV